MVTVLRAEGMRVVIFANDHEPAHVHVLVADGEAKVDLLGTGGVPELVRADGLGRADVRRALRLVQDRQAFLLARWEQMHGAARRRGSGRSG